MIFFPVLQGNATTGNFILPNNRDYYPETVLEIQLTNLSVWEQYNILIGANQAIEDQQWDNFTATSQTMVREIIHFDKQSYLTNQSQDIEYLLIELYDSNNIRLSLITYDLVRTSQQLNPFLIGMLIVVIVSSFVLMNIILVLVKYFWK